MKVIEERRGEEVIEKIMTCLVNRAMCEYSFIKAILFILNYILK